MEPAIDIFVKRFEPDDEFVWDSFVLEDSSNGTFLQSRRFLNYHPKDRFVDHSLLFYQKNKLLGVCPACEIYENGGKTFVSHMGSTYGGLVVSRPALRTEIAYSIIHSLDNYLKTNSFRKSIIKPTPNLFCKDMDDSYTFMLGQLGYSEFKELNLYIDYSQYDKEVFGNFSKLKKRQVHKCINEGMYLKELSNKAELQDFYYVLEENLKKFDRKPVHTIDELIDLKKRFSEDILFYGAYRDKELLSGTMVFEFPSIKCAHTQYLAAKGMSDNLSPMSFVYYSMAKLYLEKNYRILSWGIATEHYGNGINWGLMRNKEEFGSRHCINTIFEKAY